MAKRRMFSKELLEDDGFLSLPMESQLLYMFLSLNADDDGFLIGKKRVMEMLHLKPRHLKPLFDAGYLIELPSGAAAVKHWKLCNLIRKDRYTPTKYQTELSMLEDVPQVGYVLKEAAGGEQEQTVPAAAEPKKEDRHGFSWD